MKIQANLISASLHIPSVHNSSESSAQSSTHNSTQRSTQNLKLITTQITIRDQLSQPFLCEVSFDSTALSLSAEKLLNQTALLTLQDDLGNQRYFHGVIFSLTQGAIYQDKGLRHYQLQLRPRFYGLHGQANDQCFCDQSTLEIVQQVCKQEQFYDYDYRHLKNAYPRRYFTVQYQETAFEFLSRLLETAGIGYYFSHHQQQHTLELFDEPMGLPTLTGGDEKLSIEDYIQHWQQYRGSYYSEIIEPPLSDEHPHTANVHRLIVEKNSAQVWYDYAQNLPDATQREATAQMDLHGKQWPENIHTVKSTLLRLHAGACFKYQGQIYLITDITHHIHPQSPFNQASLPLSYSNRFTCINLQQTPFAPLKTFAKPSMPGLHRATVVSKQCNAQGKIKVNFAWDQHKSLISNWIPVSQWQANQDFAQQFIPEQGQTVIVQYVHGDLEQPVVCGAVMDEQHPPVLPLPANQHKSWWISKSQQQLIFDDSPGKQSLRLQAAKDFVVKVGAQMQVRAVAQQGHIQGNVQVTVNQGSITIAGEDIQLQGGGSSLRLHPQGLVLQGASDSEGQIRFKVNGVKHTQAVLRKGDAQQCPQQDPQTHQPHVGGKILQGQTHIRVNGKPIAHAGSKVACQHSPPGHIAEGFSHLRVNGIAVAGKHHPTSHQGGFKQASQNVWVMAK